MTTMIKTLPTFLTQSSSGTQNGNDNIHIEIYNRDWQQELYSSILDSLKA